MIKRMVRSHRYDTTRLTREAGTAPKSSSWSPWEPPQLLHALVDVEPRLVGRPHGLEVFDHVMDLSWRQRLAESGHGQALCLVVRVSPAIPDEVIEHCVRVLPGMPFTVVRRGGQFAFLGCTIPIPASLGPPAAAS